MICPQCHTENLSDAVFCAECGAKLELRCPACAVVNAPGSKFCRKCGTAIGAALGQPPAASAKKSNDSPIRVAETSASENLDGERKTVTALFADIKGSTELMQDLDPEEARAIIDPALKLMIDAAHRYDGYVVQSTGDGIFALFGAPLTVALRSRGASASTPTTLAE
jgi:double zinc ribbon protein/adenylate/guanylate cyclase family protein